MVRCTWSHFGSTLWWSRRREGWGEWPSSASTVERITTSRTVLWYCYFAIFVQFPFPQSVYAKMLYLKWVVPNICLLLFAMSLTCHPNIPPPTLAHVHTPPTFHLPPMHYAQPKDMARICEERQSFRANLGTLGADTRYDMAFDVPLMCTCGCSYALCCKLLQANCKWPSHAFSLSPPSLSLSLSATI